MDTRAISFSPLAVLSIGILLVSGVRAQRPMPLRAPISSIKIDPAGYIKSEIVIDSAERQVAGMSDYIMRNYQKDSVDYFNMYVGYYDYQVQGKTIHSPRNCLPGAGWETISSSVVAVPFENGKSVFVNRFVMANKNARAMIFYWYQGRGHAEASEYVVKWNLLRDAALHGRTDEALVRFVVPLETTGISRTDLPKLEAKADSIAFSLVIPLALEVDRVMSPPLNK